MKPTAALVALLVLLSASVAHAQSSGSPDAAAQDLIRQTLLYGIDSQVLDAIQKLRASGDKTFTRELASLLTDQRAPAVQTAVLELLRDQDLRDGEDAAKAILSSPDGVPSDLLSAAIHYASAIKMEGQLALLTPLVDSTDAAASSAAIRALGTSGDPGAVTLLLAKLKDPGFPDGRRNDVILALGDLKSSQATEQLAAIAKNADEDQVRRLYAADSLGKIGDAQALPVLKGMFAEPSALVRAYAASALANFSLDDVLPMLVSGLKDENDKVRLECAKALARTMSSSQAASAVPVLSYKARFDPVGTVRVQSIQTLGSIGTDACFPVLRDLYTAAGSSMDGREAALTALVAKWLPQSLPSIRDVVGQGVLQVDQRILEITGRILATAKDPGLREVYASLLGSKSAAARYSAIQGIAANRFSDLKDRVKKVADTDPAGAVRQQAQAALSQL
ncbi:MAG TPA: HEAT repeat domain-containing protein [Spirochaetia bacterium]|nr:HEAT repeat domain-containing protein [Spirochaetia bacterium]